MVGLGDACEWGDADCLWRVFAGVEIAVLSKRINDVADLEDEEISQGTGKSF